MRGPLLAAVGLLCFAAVVIATLALAPGLPGGGAREGSSWSRAPGGAASLHAALEDAGRAVRRHEGPVQELATSGTVLVLAPDRELRDADAAHLLGLAEAGARLVVATERPLELLEARGVRLREVGRHADARPEVPSAAARAGWPLLDASTVAAERSPGLAPLYADEGGVRIGSLAVGGGRLVVVTVPRILTNAGLADRVNRRLAAALAAGPGELVFLESVHGFRDDHGPWPWLRRRGLALLLVLLLAVPASLAWRAGARLGSPPPPPRPRPPGLAGLARAAGRLRQERGEHAEALAAIVADRLRRGLPTDHPARRWYEGGARPLAPEEALALGRALEESG